MRILTFILALSVFYMSIQSCADGDCAIVSSTDSSHFDDASHDHSQDSDDDCTPFCTCDCCGVSVTVPQNYSFQAEVIPLEHLSNYTNFYSFNYNYTHNECIWHPPTHC